jgi:hypothetical protein
MASSLPDNADLKNGRSTRSTLLKITTAATLTIPVAIVQGHLSNRWGPQPELARAVAAVNQLPSELGDWSVTSRAEPLSPYVCRTLKLAGHLHRIYEQTDSGRRVALLLLVGPGGPLVRHPPELCYESLDNRLLDSQTMTVTIDGQEHHFRLLRYEAAPGREQDFAVVYSFGCRQRWDVPGSPRLSYGGEPALLKLQLLIDGRHDRRESTVRALSDFLRQLVPAINQLTAKSVTDEDRILGAERQAIESMPTNLF